MMLDSAQACNYKTSGFVYIVREGPPAPPNEILFKVGGSEDVPERMKDLKTGNPRKLTVKKSYMVTDCKTAENVAQAAVEKKYRSDYGGGTEWFKVTDDNEHKQDFYNLIDTDLWKEEDLVVKSWDGLPQLPLAARKVQLARRQGDKSRRFLKFITSLLD